MTVAITGLGIISCIGQTLDEVSFSLKQGKSGVILDEDRIKRGFRSGLTVGLQTSTHDNGA